MNFSYFPQHELRTWKQQRRINNIKDQREEKEKQETDLYKIANVTKSTEI